MGVDVAPIDEPLLGPALAGDGSLTTLWWFVLVNLEPGSDTDMVLEAMILLLHVKAFDVVGDVIEAGKAIAFVGKTFTEFFVNLIGKCVSLVLLLNVGVIFDPTC